MYHANMCLDHLKMKSCTKWRHNRQQNNTESQMWTCLKEYITEYKDNLLKSDSLHYKSCFIYTLGHSPCSKYILKVNKHVSKKLFKGHHLKNLSTCQGEQLWILWWLKLRNLTCMTTIYWRCDNPTIMHNNTIMTNIIWRKVVFFSYLVKFWVFHKAIGKKQNQVVTAITSHLSITYYPAQSMSWYSLDLA